MPDLSWSNPFARNEGRCAKTEKNCDFTCPGLVLEQPFRTNEGRCAKTDVKLRFYLCRTCPGATLSHEMRVDRQNWRKIAILLVPDLSWSNPFARNEGRSSKTDVKLRFYLCRTSQFFLSFCTSTLISCERVALGQVKSQFFFSFWRSTLVSCERVAPGQGRHGRHK